MGRNDFGKLKYKELLKLDALRTRRPLKNNIW
jgi:hypothetical protein